METTEGTLLGGRVRYRQPRGGYRTGIEPVLLAASVPARPGQLVLEAGTGAGAGLLCLGARVPGLGGVGVERDPAMAALARHNLADNNQPFRILEDDVAAAREAGPVDHAFANPPWHDPASSRSPDKMRDAATHRAEAGLAAWIEALAGCLVPGGTVTLILPAVLAAEAIALLQGCGLGQSTLFPLWPRAGVRAKIALVQALAGARSARAGTGLVLHGAGQSYTAEAEAVLRGGAGLVL